MEQLKFLCGNTGDVCENPSMIEGTDKCCCNGIYIRFDKEKLSQNAIQLVKDLASWSNRWNRNTIYDMQNTDMDDELIVLENRAKELTKLF